MAANILRIYFKINIQNTEIAHNLDTNNNPDLNEGENNQIMDESSFTNEDGLMDLDESSQDVIHLLTQEPESITIYIKPKGL